MRSIEAVYRCGVNIHLNDGENNKIKYTSKVEPIQVDFDSMYKHEIEELRNNSKITEKGK
jgi:hypothetical protein